MSISALNSGLSGMKAFQRGLDSTANNIANAGTNGYQPERVDMVESSAAGGGVNAVNLPADAAAKTASAGAASGTDLANEMVQSLVYKNGFDMSAKVVKTANEVLGSLIDIKA